MYADLHRATWPVWANKEASAVKNGPEERINRMPQTRTTFIPKQVRID
jgi:hypothetical protein